MRQKQGIARHRIAGLTLPELLMTLGIITILLGMSLPAWQPVLEARQGEELLNTIHSAVNAGRTAAIRQARPVTVCPSRDGSRCSGSWNDGLIVFIDPLGLREPEESERLLRSIRWSGLPGTVTWRAFGNRQYLQINAMGHILHQNGNFTWCPQSADARQAHQLVLNSAGRMRLARDTTGDGIREDSQGRPLQCP